MITVERTGGGLCGQTIVRNGNASNAFERDAEVTLTDWGVSVIERGLATSRITYLVDGTQPNNGTLIADAAALRLHLDLGHQVVIHEFKPFDGSTYRVGKRDKYISIFQLGGLGNQTSSFEATMVKAIVAETSIIPQPAPAVPPAASTPPVAAAKPSMFLRLVRSVLP